MHSLSKTLAVLLIFFGPAAVAQTPPCTTAMWPGEFNVRSCGAVGDGTQDDTSAIQSAINAVQTTGGIVLFPAGTYKITSPLLIYTNVTLIGVGRNASFIQKTTNTAGTLGSIAAPGRAGISDNYNNDAIVQVVHAARNYAYHWAIKDLYLRGAGTNKNTYGIYAPRASQFEISDVYVFNASYGFYTRDSWLAAIRHTTIDTTDYGIMWDDDGSGNGTGTTLTLDNTWVVNATRRSYYFFGLSYSSFNNIASDHFNTAGADLSGFDAVYAFAACSGIALNGVGAEDVHGAVIHSEFSVVSITAMRTFAVNGMNSSGTVGYIFSDHSQLTITGSLFDPFTVAGNYFNMVIQDGSHWVVMNSTLPAGGSTFISYSGGSTLTQF